MLLSHRTTVSMARTHRGSEFDSVFSKPRATVVIRNAMMPVFADATNLKLPV